MGVVVPKLNSSDPASRSLDLVRENIGRLKELFPEALAEGKIDFEILRAILGDEVEDREEYYRFTWAGKSEARREAHKPGTGTLRPVKVESVDWEKTENLYIEGDNLEVLKLLQKSYVGKIRMIYIDPPYNTGKDFVYKDNYADNLKNYQELTGQIDDRGNKISTNSETDGRYHSNWLNMMYPRLRLARNLLRDDGAIFISIDDNEIENLRKLCDEIFGEASFVGQITLLNNPKGRSHDKFLANCHEFLLIYSRTVQEKGAYSVPKTAEEIAKDYPLSDQKGLYRELELRNTHREFGRFNRPNLYYSFHVDSKGNVFSEAQPDTTAVYPVWEDGFEGCWTWGKEKAVNELSLITAKQVKGEWKIYRKAYATNDTDSVVTKQLKSIWTDKQFHTEKGQACFNALFGSKNKIFQSPKSIELLQTLIGMAHASGELILDFFSGSGTTAHAVMQLNAEDGGNRKFIQVQLPEQTPEKSEARSAGYATIADIGKERIRRAAKKICEDYPDKAGELDLGFKVFRLDSSNIKTWDGNPEELEQSLFDMVSNIKSDRSEEDVLYEILLKYGLDITAPVTEKAIHGKRVFLSQTEGASALFLCLADDITNRVAEGIGQWKETLGLQTCRVLFKDTGFTDVEKTNAVRTLKRFGITEIKSI